jgi:hypothetical protein
MRELFGQDRAISPATVRGATQIIGGLFVACIGLIVLQVLLGALGMDASGVVRRVLTALMQIGLGAGLLLAIYMIVRLLGEGLMAQQRLQDRLTILTDELSSIRTANTPAAKPGRKSSN